MIKDIDAVLTHLRDIHGRTIDGDYLPFVQQALRLCGDDAKKAAGLLVQRYNDGHLPDIDLMKIDEQQPHIRTAKYGVTNDLDCSSSNSMLSRSQNYDVGSGFMNTNINAVPKNEPSAKDIETLMKTTGCSRFDAEIVLESNNNDVHGAIVFLTQSEDKNENDSDEYFKELERKVNQQFDLSDDKAFEENIGSLDEKASNLSFSMDGFTFQSQPV